MIKLSNLNYEGLLQCFENTNPLNYIGRDKAVPCLYEDNIKKRKLN